MTLKEMISAAGIEADNIAKLSFTSEVLTQKLYELNDAQTLTNGQQAEMSSIVDKLNEGIPNLNLAIDEHTGKLNLDIDEVKKSIEVQKEYYKVMAAQDDLKEIGESLYDTEKNLTDARGQLAIQSEKVNDILNKGSEELNKMADAQVKVQAGDLTGKAQEEFDRAQKAYNELGKEYESEKKKQDKLQKTVTETEKSYKGLNDEYDKSTQYIEDHSDALDVDTKSMEDNSQKAQTLAGTTIEYNGEMIRVTEESVAAIDELNQKYDEAVQSRTDELMNNLNLFEEFNGGAETSVDQLFTNLESNLNGMTTWSDNLKTLSERGINEGLLKTLQDAGPSSASTVQALCAMTDPELQKYSDMWAKTYKVCYDDAVEFNKSLKDETDKGIQEIIDNDRIYGEFYDHFEQIGVNAMAGLTDGMDEMKGSVWSKTTEISLGSVEASKLAFDQHSPSKKFRKVSHNNMEGLILGEKDKEKEVISSYAKMSDSIVDATAYKESSRTARAVYSGEYADSIVARTAEEPAKATSESKEQALNLPENITIYSVLPNGEVLAKATAPFIDVILGDKVTRKKRGGA